MERKRYKQAPLPFTGQKRMCLAQFEKVLNEIIEDDGEGWTIIDVFGGSGLLSHNAKHIKPKARVIYNDFDGYAERLKHIIDINRLRQILHQYLSGIIPKRKPLDKEVKAKIINKINEFEGYKDLNCLASWFLFSGQQVGTLEDLTSKAFWNGIRQSDYPLATGYLDGLEVAHQSFRDLMPHYLGQEKVLFILDPPYLCTHQESYKQANYFDLIDFLELIRLTKPPYVFFSSTKSEFIRFIEWWVNTKQNNWQNFEKVHRIIFRSSVNYNGKYEDNLVYKF